MATPLTPQAKSANELVQALGLKGYRGLTFAIGSPATTLTIAVGTNPLGVLLDGTIFDDTALVAATVTGVTTNGANSLYLDWAQSALAQSDLAPVWSVGLAASPPSPNALAVAAVTVAGGVITTITPVTALGTWVF